jgi:hypothetical protein
MDSGPRVEVEEMHPDPPDRVHRGICGLMIVAGIALIVVAAVFNLWGAVRIILALAGVALVILGFLLALGVKGFKLKASASGGIEAAADMPTGYTKTMKVSESLVEGSPPTKTGIPPPRDGTMPPKDGTMPPKTVR